MVSRDFRAALAAAGLLTLGTMCAAAQPASLPASPPLQGGETLALPPDRGEQAIQVGLRLESEAVSVLRGGLRRDTTFNTVAIASLAVDTGPLGLWSGGRLAASLAVIDSGRPSLYDIGDAQVVSNIEAPSVAKIYELWLRQRLGAAGTEVRVGLIDLNTHFAVVETATSLLNSSFGITPSISLDVPTSIYPELGLGLIVSGGSSSRRWRAGLFQSDPAHRSRALDGGGMGIVEVALGPESMPGLKIGAWSWRRQGAGSGPRSSGGAYVVLQQSLGRLGAGRLSGFVVVGSTPGRNNADPRFLALGAALEPPLRNRPHDLLEVGLARAGFEGPGLDAETAYEIAYVARLRDGVEVQPDLQVITRPGGGAVPTAIVGIVRLRVELS